MTMTLAEARTHLSGLGGAGSSTPAAVDGLLYYARGFGLGLGRGRIVTGEMVADANGPVFRDTGEAATAGPADLETLREVALVFGGTDPDTLLRGILAERPWRNARDRATAADPSPVVRDADLATEFSWCVEGGLDAMADLGLSAMGGRASWERPFGLWMTIARFEGHPLFDDAESRRLRVALGLGEVPDDCSGIAMR